MLYALFVKPVALAALGGTLWLLWRAGDGFEAAEARRHRRRVAVGAIAIAALVLGPPAWAVLSEHPGDVLRWTAILAVAVAAVWGYARLIGAARRRAPPPGGDG
ncbi:MAG TPA: hypothetical protein VMM55_03375 [Thermohalobaculum sp.]|nr:hypothetical protein [Thermohalobaculum sp.]